jgi:phospholipase/carboxylesterase
VVKSAKAKGKTTLVIWFHFLGGSGADWEQSLKSQLGDQLPSVEWYFPNAPQRPVTNYDGKVASCWFDQLEGQVMEGMETPGLEESVAFVHALLRQAEALGMPPQRIILGGMSQGGVLALKAGLTYERPLAGIAAISAWVPPSLNGNIRHPSTPLFLGNGDIDEVVPVDIFQKGQQKLQKAGCSRISTKIYPGLMHTFKPCEREDIKGFINSVLQCAGQGHCATVASIKMGSRGQSYLPATAVATPLRNFRCPRAPAAARPPASEVAGIHADRHRRHECVERGVRPEHRVFVAREAAPADAPVEAGAPLAVLRLEVVERGHEPLDGP